MNTIKFINVAIAIVIRSKRGASFMYLFLPETQASQMVMVLFLITITKYYHDYFVFYLESGSKNKAIMMVASTIHVRYMVLISNISESGGLSKLSIAWFPITQKLDPQSRNSSSDSIVLLSPLPPPWAPLDNTAGHTNLE